MTLQERLRGEYSPNFERKLANEAADRIDALEKALQYMVNVCPPINSQGEEAHERARAALGDG